MAARQAGQALVEVVLAVAVAASVLPGLATGLIASREGKVQVSQRLGATALTKEAEEAVRIVREAAWAGIATSGTYHPVPSGGTWTLASGSETIGGFTRSILISDVFRDNSGTVVSSGGTADPSTKKVTITVSWGTTPLVSSVTSTLYLTRFVTDTVTQTTQAEFDAGTKTNVVTTNTRGGEVTLAAGGRANWCEPNLSIAAADLPKSGVANAVSAIPGQVVAGTGENASGVSFANVVVSDTNPPTATISGTFDGYKTNDIYGQTGYAYLATDNNFKEIVIIDISTVDPVTNKYAEAGYFNAPGNGNGNSVFVTGNVGLMTAGDTLYSFDLSSKNGSRGLLDANGVALAGTGTSTVVVGSYAYVAINSTTTQLQIVDVSNPANLTVVGSAQVGSVGAVDVFVNDTATRAYLATATSSGPEFFIIDVTQKTGSHTALGSYEANGMSPEALTVVPGNRAILVGVGGEEYQVINITDETAPLRCGGLNVDSGVRGIASVLEGDGDAFSYSITGDATAELKIIEGGPGGQFAMNGTFESDTIALPTSSAINRFFAHSVRPVGTTIAYQFAVADAVGGSCVGAPFTFVGPDGTGTTTFATDSAIPMSDDGLGFENPGGCLRYKVFLNSVSAGSAPEFEDMTIIYSP